jgi:flagellar M-ring protein FliF
MRGLPVPSAIGGARGSRRILLILAAAAAIVAVWGVGRWASTPTYVTLYSDLDLNEAGAIDDKLQKGGIPHRLGGGGTEVMVPVSDVARARVALAKDGLPTGGRPGLELFDKPTWGMTDFTQRVTFQRALEGELARTIAGIHGIDRAQVHLVLPTPSALRKLERPARASVVIKCVNGASLSPETVQGITYIVSNSVEQLSSDNVAVMDDSGRLLSVPVNEDSGAGMTSWQLEIQRAVEERLTDKIEGLMTTVVGLGRVRAQVTADMSFDRVDRTVETYDPETQVLSSEQRSETEPGAGSTGTQTVINNSYQNSRKLEKNTSSVGKLTRLTAAIIVDEAALGAGKGAGGAELTTDRLEAMVRDAIGADATRGDRVTVVAVPFGASGVPEGIGGGAVGTSGRQKIDPFQIGEHFLRPAIGLIAILALLILAIRALGLKGGSRPATAQQGGDATGEAEGENPLALGAGNRADLTLVGGQRQGRRAGVREPETTAQAMRAWLSDSQ